MASEAEAVFVERDLVEGQPSLGYKRANIQRTCYCELRFHPTFSEGRIIIDGLAKISVCKILQADGLTL
jgi:hypothetical protein